MDVIAAALIDGLAQRGWQVEVIGIDPLGARLMVTDAELVAERCELDILKEAFAPPPAKTPYGPALPKSLGRQYARDGGDYSLAGLATRLEAADFYDDQAFAEYGVSEEDIAGLRRWAQGWADDIRRRLYAGNFDFDEDGQ